MQGSPLTMQTQHSGVFLSNVFFLILKQGKNVWSIVKAGVFVRNRIKDMWTESWIFPELCKIRLAQVDSHCLVAMRV